MKASLSETGLFTMTEPGQPATWFICDTGIGCRTEKERLKRQLREIETFLNCRVELTPHYTIDDTHRRAIKTHTVNIIPEVKP